MLDCLARFLIGPAADFAQQLKMAVDGFASVGPPMSERPGGAGKLHNFMAKQGDVEPFFNHVHGHSRSGPQA